MGAGSGRDARFDNAVKMTELFSKQAKSALAKTFAS
jgi:hypothetical protein